MVFFLCYSRCPAIGVVITNVLEEVRPVLLCFSFTIRYLFLFTKGEKMFAEELSRNHRYHLTSQVWHCSSLSLGFCTSVKPEISK